MMAEQDAPRLSMASFADLPVDVLVLIFRHLAPPEFLALTGSTRSLLGYRSDSAYWRALVRSTFRLPPQPLLDTDGSGWRQLYWRLTHQAHVFTWGSDVAGNLGLLDRSLVTGRRTLPLRAQSTGWPCRMRNLEDVGVIVDVMCGSSCTVLLNDIGQLWAVGTAASSQMSQLTLEPLSFPAAYPATTRKRYEPSTAIRQYSVGDDHVLGLADDNKIWKWRHFAESGKIAGFYNIPVESARRASGQLVTNVVAGRNMSFAYVRGVGIIHWSHADPTELGSVQDFDMYQTQCQIVPDTAFLRSAKSHTRSIGEVRNMVSLGEFLVFTTRENGVFCLCTTPKNPSDNQPRELKGFCDPGADIVNIFGRSLQFAVLTSSGKVFSSGYSELRDIWFEGVDQPSPRTIPALQHTGVVQLAFGDSHLHALHSDGAITSHGREIVGCGSLGLGSRDFSYLRGVYFEQRPGDGTLKVPDWSDGRRTVWFEYEKEFWLSDTCQKAATNEARARAMATQADPEAVSLIGEWFEREGRNWEEGPARDDVSSRPGTSSKTGKGSNSGRAFHGVKIAAGGVSSAALVIVDRDQAEETRKKYLMAPSPPSGTQSPQTDGSTTPPPPSTSPPATAIAEDSQSTFRSTLRSVLDWFLRGPPLVSSGAGEDNPTGAQPGAAPAPRPTGAVSGGGAGAGAGSGTGAGGRTTRVQYRRNVVQQHWDGGPYIWDEQPFPRLQYPDGRVMEGEVPVTRWKGGYPVIAGKETPEGYE